MNRARASSRVSVGVPFKLVSRVCQSMTDSEYPPATVEQPAQLRRLRATRKLRTQQHVRSPQLLRRKPWIEPRRRVRVAGKVEREPR